MINAVVYNQYLYFTNNRDSYPHSQNEFINIRSSEVNYNSIVNNILEYAELHSRVLQHLTKLLTNYYYKIAV